MLFPDVTEIIDDPDVGGGVPFKVIREQSVRSLGGYETTNEEFDATGNIQPQEMGNQPSTAEDQLTEAIVIYSRFAFQTGSNKGTEIVQADIVVWNEKNWRVTKVDNWSEWGFTRAYATYTMDSQELVSSGGSD